MCLEEHALSVCRLDLQELCPYRTMCPICDEYHWGDGEICEVCEERIKREEQWEPPVPLGDHWARLGTTSWLPKGSIGRHELEHRIRRR